MCQIVSQLKTEGEGWKAERGRGRREGKVGILTGATPHKVMLRVHVHVSFLDHLWGRGVCFMETELERSQDP